MGKKFPLRPAHPERTCWGCDRYCPAGDMICGNGTERTQHPIELMGEGWESEGLDPVLRPLPIPVVVVAAGPAAPPGGPECASRTKSLTGNERRPH